MSTVVLVRAGAKESHSEEIGRGFEDDRRGQGLDSDIGLDSVTELSAFAKTQGSVHTHTYIHTLRRTLLLEVNCRISSY